MWTRGSVRTLSRVNLLIRAQRDPGRGEPWLARDRLVGALAQRGTDEALLDLLARTYVAIGDLPAAGGAWFVSARTGGPVTAADWACSVAAS